MPVLVFRDAAGGVGRQAVGLVVVLDVDGVAVGGDVDPAHAGAVGRGPEPAAGIQRETGDGFALGGLHLPVGTRREVVDAEALVEGADDQVFVLVLDDAVHERLTDDIDQFEGVRPRIEAVHARPRAGIDAAVAGLHDGHAVVAGQGILPDGPACHRIEGRDPVAVGGDPDELPDPGEVGDGRSAGQAGGRREIGERLVFRVEAAQIPLFAADPNLPVGTVADGPDGVAGERMGRIVGYEAAEPGLIGHPAPEAAVPGARPDVAVAVAEQAADTFAAEGGDVQFVGKLLFDRAGGGIVDEQAVGGSDPVQAVLIQQALDLRLVQDDFFVDQGLGLARFQVRQADLVDAVAEEQPVPVQILDELEGSVRAVRPDGLDGSSGGVEEVDAVVAGGEGQIAVRGHAGPEGGERRGLGHVFQLAGILVVFPDSAGRRDPHRAVGRDVDVGHRGALELPDQGEAVGMDVVEPRTLLRDDPDAAVGVKPDGLRVQGTVFEIAGIGEGDEFLAGIVEDPVLRSHPDAPESILADGRQICLRQAVPAGEAGIEMMRLSGV